MPGCDIRVIGGTAEALTALANFDSPAPAR
jgi:hypothetical protein